MKSALKKYKSKVLIVDDHAIVRQGLAQLVNHEQDLEVCGEAEDESQAWDAIKRLKPDVAIVDMSLKNRNALDLIKNVTTEFPKLPVLVLSMHEESVYAERVLKAGAKGYIMKQEATEIVFTAIRKVLSGEIYLSPKMGSKMLLKISSNGARKAEGDVEDRLSNRELEVFQLVAQGFATGEIAKQLNLSVKTIETYRAHIKEKMGLESASELVKHAIHWLHSKNANQFTT